MAIGQDASFLGIEFGGTKLQIGIGPANGRLEALWRTNVDPSRGVHGILEAVADGIDELLDKARFRSWNLAAVGVGFGGPVDRAAGKVVKSHQIRGWEGFPLADWLCDKTGLPVLLENDCDCAAVAEAHFGAGQGHSPVFFVTVGSGIGGGLVIDGVLYRGCGAGAGEIGHLRVPAEATPAAANHAFPSFSWATVESQASGWGIETQYQRLAGSRSAIPKKVPEIAAAARQGDALAQAVLEHAIETLALGISHVIALLCPRRIVIGGGVSLLGEEQFFQPLRVAVERIVFQPFAGLYEIVPAKLGEEVVVHGALALARDWARTTSAES